MGAHQVKEIRETPNKRHHKFVEFYDVRAADAALKVSAAPSVFPVGALLAVDNNFKVELISE